VTTAAAVLRDASTLLSDVEGVQWADDELLSWLNAGIRDVVALAPSAYQVREAIPVTAFDAYQKLPDGVIRLVKTLRNVRGDLTTKGRPVRVLSDAQMDNNCPNWMNASPEDDVRHVVYDSNTPAMFFVWPPIAADGFIEAVVSRLPPPVENPLQELPIGSEYHNALVDFVMHRAMAKNVEVAGSAELAQTYWSLFTARVSEKVGGDSISSADNKGARDKLPGGASGSA
jgi:hypothetical protein